MLPLRTARLTVRMLRAADVSALVAYRNDPAIAAFQDWGLPYTEAAGQRLAHGQAHLDGPTDGEWVQMAVEHDGAIVGDVAVELRAGGGIATLGFTLAAAHHGNGYATEAVEAVVDALVEQRVHRFVATLDPHNVPSMRVLERVGFTFECLARDAELVRGDWVDDLRYSMLADDRRAWVARNQSRAEDVTLVEILADDAYLWGRLATHYSQQAFVAPMPKSFRDALFPEVVDGTPVVPWMRGVLADGERVGFVMTAQVTDAHPEPYLWRLLVDRRHQRRGIGERVIQLLIERCRSEGATSLLTSWGEGPGSPRPFYERLGFVPTGRIVDDETEARLSW